MRAVATVGISVLAGIALGQSSPAFSNGDRQDVLRFWSRPDRYTVGLPSDVLDKGAWQVRLTVSGSSWLWNYQRGKKNPLSDAVVTVTDEQKIWENWVSARIARDRWLAWRDAQSRNERDLGVRLPEADKTISIDEPADPGPIPSGLKGWLGQPPRFAEACIPMEHRVVFDDLQLTYRDRHRPGSPRYAYYRFDGGVGDGGVSVRTMPKEKLNQLFEAAGVTEAEAKVMNAVSLLEGGFDAVNTYDTGFVSIGFIQFACLKEGGGSLGGMLRLYKREKPREYDRDFRRFGIDVTPEGKLVVLDLTTGEERVGPDAAAEIIEDKRLVAVFQRAGRLSEPFVSAQIKAAKTMYMPIDDVVSVTVDGKTLTGRVSDIVRSEAGMAVLMDRKVNTGNINPFPGLVADLAAEVKPASLADLAAYERDLIDACRYRANYLTYPGLSQPALAPARATNNTSRGAGGSRNTRGGGKGSTQSRGSGGSRTGRTKG